MKTYMVYLNGIRLCSAQELVKANSKEEAEKIAREKAWELDWDNSDIVEDKLSVEAELEDEDEE